MDCLCRRINHGVSAQSLNPHNTGDDFAVRYLHVAAVAGLLSVHRSDSFQSSMQRGTVREEIWRMLGRCTSKLQRLFSAICGLAALATIGSSTYARVNDDAAREQAGEAVRARLHLDASAHGAIHGPEADNGRQSCHHFVPGLPAAIWFLIPVWYWRSS